MVPEHDAKMASLYDHFGIEDLRSIVESISSPAFGPGIRKIHRVSE
jgi:hypothetical protein